jgi:hypothetical protein
MLTHCRNQAKKTNENIRKFIEPNQRMKPLVLILYVVVLLNVKLLTNLCPSPNGACIHQARALYQAIYDVNVNYMDCFEVESSARGVSKNQEEIKEPIQETKSLEIELFPNPASNKITLAGIKEKEVFLIQIKDVTGRTISELKVNTNNYFANIDLRLINGIYFVIITNEENKNIHKKLLITK